MLTVNTGLSARPCSKRLSRWGVTCGALEITSRARLERPSGRLDVCFFGGDRRRDHRLDQSAVLSEPSETRGASNTDQKLGDGVEVAELVIKGEKNPYPDPLTRLDLINFSCSVHSRSYPVTNEQLTFFLVYQCSLSFYFSSAQLVFSYISQNAFRECLWSQPHKILV